MTERIRQLKSRLTTKYPMSVEKFRIMVESYENSRGEPTILRRAKFFCDMMDRFPINIMDGELIVGTASAKYMGVELESCGGTWTREELEALQEDGYLLSNEDLETILVLNRRSEDLGHTDTMNLVVENDPRLEPYLRSGMILPPWKPRRVDGTVIGGGASSSGLGLGPGLQICCIDWENVMQRGLRSYIEECNAAIAGLRYFGHDSFEKGITLRSMLMTLEAACRLARRYEALAREKASVETDSVRRMELLKIAEHCARVPDERPRTFPEAMQMFWFIYLCINPGGLASYGRFDQYMYPFYRADIDAGRITDEEVIEYLEALRIKDMEFNTIGGKEGRKRAAGNAKWHNMTIAGKKPDGSDATNDLSYLILEAAIRCPLPHHTISMRVADTTPLSLIKKGVECQAKGLSMPAFISDRSYTKFFTMHGASEEDARDFCLAGCVDPTIPGRARTLACGMYVTPMMLEFFLNDGVDPKTGLQVGHRGPDLNSYQTYDDFLSALKDEIRYYMSLGAEKNNLENYAMRLLYPLPFRSALFRGGIQSGQDLHVRQFDFENNAVLNAVGMVNLGNSVYAIKKLVFDEKCLTLKEFSRILSADWEGHEDLRQRCLSLPKYGNGIDEVDQVVADLYEHWRVCAESFPAAYGGVQMGTAMSVTSYAPGGAITGATPDGRHKGDILADAAVSAGNGQDKNGPLALMRSALKIPQDGMQAMLFNMKFLPSTLATDEDREKLANLIRTYLENGGKHVQFNIVDAETLKDAKLHPESHEELMVRVAGFSTYFVSLNGQLQDEIIGRTAHTL